MGHFGALNSEVGGGSDGGELACGNWDWKV